MDVKFTTDLQTFLRTLGHEKPFAPPKSQDPADKMLHEYYVASVMASIGEKRKDIMKEMLIQDAKDVDTLIAAAIKQDAMQQGTLFTTGNYSAILKVNKPVQRTDIKVFITELIKRGVDQVTISQAEIAAQSSNAPAKTLTVVTVGTTRGGK